MNLKQPQRNKGLADWIFIAIIVGLNVLGTAAVQVTKTPDSPIEQLSEKLLKMQTGQEVDFSAHLKKDETGKVTATDLKAKTTNPTPTVEYHK